MPRDKPACAGPRELVTYYGRRLSLVRFRWGKVYDERCVFYADMGQTLLSSWRHDGAGGAKMRLDG